MAKGRPTLDTALDALLALVAVHAAVVDAPLLNAPVSADPDDEQFLAAALAGDAAWIVSGDQHLLAVSGWSGIVSFPRLNEVVNAKRAVTPETALRLAQVTGMSADFWLGLQQDWDLWHAVRSAEAAEIGRLTRLPHTG